MSEAMTIEWLAEEREVPALRRVCKLGDIIDAPRHIGEQLIAQGLSGAVETLTLED